MGSGNRCAKTIICFCIVFAMEILFWQSAKAESLQERISKLQPLPLHYGANDLQLNGKDMLITRGEFENGNAWGGDAYTVLVKQKDGVWQLVRHENAGWEGILTTTQPHTGEDSITAVSFLVPRTENSSKNITALYLLTTHRIYEQSPLDIVQAEFTLDVVQPDNDFGIYYFHTLKAEMSKGKYCNADSAAYHELGIPLPGDGKEFSCVKVE